jgi:predicted O-methyltransferase YrrM
LSDPEYETGIVDERVEKYVTSLAPSDPVLLELEKDAEKRSLSTIGPVVGRIISMILKSAKPERALEVGTATGYSGIWIARSLQGDQKKLTTIELDPERRKEAQANFNKAGVDKYVEILAGDARSLVPEIAKNNPGLFDLVFLDIGDKSVYVDLLNCCIDALRVGGFLIADNTLFGGAVASPQDKTPNAAAVRKFNELVFSEKRLDAALIPLRCSDIPGWRGMYGFTVAYKKKE